ncbi:MAG: DUF3379 family protein [Gammaproteobacteria bacterium]|nr:DUF3379 family protein [Gammaproteobacteria bacterium]
MNCLEFRRHCLAEPHSTDEAFAAHEQSCSACAAHAHQVRTLDARIAAGFRVDPPAGLERRVLVRQALRSARRSWRIPLGLAAAVLLGVSVLLVDRDGVPDPVLGEALFAHVVAPHPPRVNGIDVGSNTETVLAALDLPISAPEGLLAAVRCRLRDRWVAHLVLAVPDGEVDVLIMPQEKVTVRTVYEHGDLQALVLPCPKGSLAIVGRAGESLAALEQRLRESTAWL